MPAFRDLEPVRTGEECIDQPFVRPPRELSHHDHVRVIAVQELEGVARPDTSSFAKFLRQYDLPFGRDSGGLHLGKIILPEGPQAS